MSHGAAEIWSNMTMRVCCRRFSLASHMSTLDGFVEQVAWKGHEVLIQRPIKGDINGHGLLLPASSPTSLLSEGGYGPCFNHQSLSTPFCRLQSLFTTGDSSKSDNVTCSPLSDGTHNQELQQLQRTPQSCEKELQAAWIAKRKKRRL